MRNLFVVLVWAFLLATCLPGFAATEAVTPCELKAFSLPFSRYPVQTDPHATYYVAAIEQHNTDNPGIIVSDDFPYSAYFSIAIYTPEGQFISSVKNNAIPTFGPNINPNLAGNPVFASPRHFTLDSRTANSLTIPPESEANEFIIVMRNYEPFNGQNYRPAPLSLLGGLTCGNAFDPGKAAKQPTQTPQQPDALPLPLPDTSTNDYVNDINFYKIGATPFADGTNGYLGTSLYADFFSVIQVPAYPSFFNTLTVTPSSLYPSVDVQYASLASYGANIAVRNVIAADSTHLIPAFNSKSAYFVLIPQRLIKTSRLYRKLIRNKCDGINFMVLQPAGIVPRGYQPYIVFREKAPSDEFSGNFSHVPLYDNGHFNDMTDGDKQDFAAQNYISSYAPIGHQCTESQFNTSACGYSKVMDELNACKNLMGQY